MNGSMSAAAWAFAAAGGGAAPRPPAPQPEPGLVASPAAAAVLSDCEAADASPAAVMVASPRALATGSRLVGDVFVGPFLGAGMSARVYELVTRDGKPTGKVVKVAHTDLGHRAVNAIWIGMEREWVLGWRLRAALQAPGGGLPGFMRVCDALVARPPRRGCAGGGCAGGAPAPERPPRFAGILLEKLNGWEVYKRVATPEFHNISYVREMLFQVFSSLDRAQRAAGFHHADLGMRNVMEHYPSPYSEEELRAREQALRAALERRRARAAAAHGAVAPPRRGAAAWLCGMAGCGGAPPAAAQEPPAVEPPVPPTPPGTPLPTPPPTPPPPPSASEVSSRPAPVTASRAPGLANLDAAACMFFKPRPGFSCNADGSRLPLGPRLEFIIIDYGVAKFDERLARETGGFEAERTRARTRGLFAAGAVAFLGKGGKVDLGKDRRRRGPDGHPSQLAWHLLATRQSGRFWVKTTPKGATPLAEPPRGGAPPPPPGAPAPAVAVAPASRVAPPPPAGVPAAAASGGAAVATGAIPMQYGVASRVGVVERAYRNFWQRKGDVFHLLLGLAVALDGRCWPAEDEEAVRLFASLVFHVTGVHVRASFAPEAAPGARLGAQQDAAAAALPAGRGARRRLLARMSRYGAVDRWFSWGRRMRLRLAAHISPFNSGLTAAEALAAPFFFDARPGGAPARGAAAAGASCCVERAFPRCSAAAGGGGERGAGDDETVSATESFAVDALGMG